MHIVKYIIKFMFVVIILDCDRVIHKTYKFIANINLVNLQVIDFYNYILDFF